jgi:hypothetical protein
MEAMSVGCAVVLLDIAGLGPMVTSDNFDDLRPLNFGAQTLRDEITAEGLITQIQRFDAADAARVRDLVRSQASLSAATEQLVDIYESVIAEHAAKVAVPLPRRPDRFTALQALSTDMFWRWRSSPESRRERLKRLPGITHALRATRRNFTPKG